MAADRVTDAMVEAAARVVCEVTGETWDHIGSFAQDVLKDTQRAALTAALRAEAGAVGVTEKMVTAAANAHADYEVANFKRKRTSQDFHRHTRDAMRVALEAAALAQARRTDAP